MKKWLMVIFILILAGSLRYYRLNDLFVFGGDEEYQSILAQTIVKNFHIIWVGVTAGHTGFYLGPLWTYFSAFWSFLAKGSPLILGFVSSGIGILTTALVIFTGKKLFNQTVGLVAGLLYATLPLIVFFDQKYWNPSLVPFLSVAMLLSLSQIKADNKWWLVFCFCFGLIFHTHLSLLPFGLIAAYMLSTNKIDKKNIFLGVLIFLILYSPLIFFDYFHKGSNIMTPLRFKEFSSSQSVQSNPIRHFEVLFQSLGRLWYLNPHTSNADNILYACSPFAYLDQTSILIDQISTRTKPYFWVSFSSLILILWFIIFSFKRNNFNQKLLSLALLLIALAYLFLPVATHEYYLLGLYPLILFLPGILFNSISKIFKQLLLTLILICSALGIFTIFTTSDDFGIGKKQKLISKVLDIIERDSFEIDQMGICQHYGGWRYLFSISGRFPEKSATDESLGWLYPDEISISKAKYKIIFHEARVPVNFDPQNVKTISEGGFKAYVIKIY